MERRGRPPQADVPVPLKRAVIAAAMVAATYYLTGRLGLLLAIPPGYASAAWPPSGIALAAMLLVGWRVAPGIWLGSFFLNLGTQFSAATPLESFGVPAAIATGAVAQAALGAWLIRRRGYPENLLTAGTGVVPLLVLGGPVACLLNPTVAVGSLWLAGHVPAAAAPFNWWTWWVGDSIGVLLFAPLVLLWSLRPWQTWLRRQVYVTAPLALLFAVVVALFVFISRREDARVATEFHALATDIQQGLRAKLDATLVALSSIEGLYASTHDVTPSEFDAFTLRLVRHLDGVTALAWAPAGTVTPRAGRQVALGLDSASEPVRRQALEAARSTGQPTATAPVRLATGEPGLLVVLPVRGAGPPDASAAPIRGYALAVFTLDGLLGDAPHRASAAGLRLALTDRGANGGPELLYGATGSTHDLSQEFVVDFAGRAWTLELALAEQALVVRRSGEAWLVLAGGLLLTVLLGVLLLAGVGHAAQIEALVAERTEALRRAGAQLARSNRELEQYAYVASHDLKAPLRTIASFAQLLNDRHGGYLEREAHEFLDFIRGGAGRMQALIDDLLELSRLDARREVASLPMRVAVDEACGALAADLAQCGAWLEVGELPTVRGDPRMLSQLWQNLVDNAIKFRRPGCVPEIRITAVERAADWAFSIADNGIGIAPAHHEHVFRVFRRLHPAEDYPGTGIGLALCRKVVQVHGGEIWVEPTTGPGATITFTLPRAGPPA